MSNLETETKKKSIIESATAMFAKKGFDGVSIRQIAEISSCNLAAVSYYFGGKEKLYAECLRPLDEEEIGKVCRLLVPATTKVELESTLLRFCTAFCQMAHQHALIIRIHINDLNAKETYSPNLENTIFEPLAKSINDFLQEGIKSRLLSPHVNTVLLARILLSLMISETVFVRGHTHFENFCKELISNCTGSIYA